MQNSLSDSWQPVTRGWLLPYLTNLHQLIIQIGARQMSSQADADALTAAVTNLTGLIVADDAQINTAVSAIGAALAAPKVDLAAAQAAVVAAQAAIADLSNAANAVSGLVPPAAPAA